MPARNHTHLRAPQHRPWRSNQPEEDAIDMLLELGDQHLLSGQYGVAERIFRTALERMRRRAYPEVDRAIALKGLSTATRLRGNWVEARKLSQQADQLIEEKREALESLYLRPCTVPPIEEHRQANLSQRFQRPLQIMMWTLLTTCYILVAVILFHCVTGSAHEGYVGCGRGLVFHTHH